MVMDVPLLPAHGSWLTTDDPSIRICVPVSSSIRWVFNSTLAMAAMEAKERKKEGWI